MNRRIAKKRGRLYRLGKRTERGVRRCACCASPPPLNGWTRAPGFTTDMIDLAPGDNSAVILEYVVDFDAFPNIDSPNVYLEMTEDGRIITYRSRVER